MPNCVYYETCGLDDSADPTEKLCILHSTDPNKDVSAFATALKIHRESHEDRFFQFIFPEEISFVNNTFHKKTDFRKATFRKQAQFKDAVFLDEVDFAGATFEHPVGFNKARFEQSADFSYAAFAGVANFENAQFAKTANFYAAAVYSADFSWVTFQTDARFEQVVFAEEPVFLETTFAGTANFCDAGFNGGVLFEGTRFLDKANFSLCSFARAGRFPSASFADEVLFVKNTFSETRIRVGSTPRLIQAERSQTPPVADFTNARFEQPSRVRFNRINHRINDQTPPGGFRARFINCPIESVQFEDIRWHRKAGRMVLQDELDVVRHGSSFYETYRLSQEDRYESVAIAYRRLVNNFDSSGSYDLAEDCYCGALEMTRLDPSRPRFVRGLLSMYRWASFYGSDYQRAFWVLLVLLAAFGIGFALLPVGLSPKSAAPASAPLATGQRIVAGIFHSLEVASFERDPLYTTTGRLGRLASIGETILVPAQLALFLLAVRRRFRR